MKKIIILFLAIAVIAGCSDDTSDKGSKEDSKEVSKDTTIPEGEVYSINETAEITNPKHGFTYEVTVNSFELTDKYKDKTMDELKVEGFPDAKLAVANVTIKNIGDQVFKPSQIKNLLLTVDGNGTGKMDLSPSLNVELEPGKEITKDLVFFCVIPSSELFLEFERYSEYEAKFSLPNAETNK
ncbi:hypothetical protein CFK37_12175 [Virgibacillus phasianinus]|uniref:DUF4352 domain-containing protein n=1 Tax=Virgibacillus phasianinus TaxID=2017483 RepID=A0A220U423_9BACI|nr:DUF4352 domain-containing protein [Virgibacillus phasianinus]ASK62850.1 hypothetical protein CFK37_12175 [Virgibacillus phasianinus]